MVLYHFPKHPWTFLQAGTLVSRFRQCMGPTAIAYMRRMTRKEPGDAARWIFDPLAAAELVDMFHTEDEVDKRTLISPSWPILIGMSVPPTQPPFGPVFITGSISWYPSLPICALSRLRWCPLPAFGSLQPLSWLQTHCERMEETESRSSATTTIWGLT